MSFDDGDVHNYNEDDDDKDDGDADDDECVDDAFAGDDPPVAIPGCSTKASQLQVNNTSIYQSKEEENAITVAISAKSLQKFSTNTSTHICPTRIQGSHL